MDLEQLRRRIGLGESFEYLLFWGHTARGPHVTSACLSQWYPASFTVDDVFYPTAEHWMMAEKARLFADDEMLARILEAPDPAQAKKLGAKVRGFDQERWQAARMSIVVRGNIEKFAQNAPLSAFLRATGDKVLVEASPVDSIWGIGLASEDPRAVDPRAWLGLNLLGFALMQVRARLVAPTAATTTR